MFFAKCQKRDLSLHILNRTLSRVSAVILATGKEFWIEQAQTFAIEVDIKLVFSPSSVDESVSQISER